MKKYKIKETTYNKYKRQNKELRSMFPIEIVNFVVDRKDFQKRIDFIHKLLVDYRAQNEK